ncbi:MAG: chitobiase/beta-hexosaminidase C-terminal domain-containing protein [Verrucomicrobia bacterium]|nr:chitobiase/beta-hexosaminidase C-terminal domain-containing protein [Verrucomicrobiota bacterium]
MKNTTISSAMAATFLMAVMALFVVPPTAFGQTEVHYRIYGVVTTPDGTPLPGVTLQFSGGLPAQISDQSGKYSVPTPAELDQYTVTPNKTGYEFASKQKPALILLDHAEVNFVATATKSSVTLAPESLGATSATSSAVTVSKASVTYVAAAPPPIAPSASVATLATTNQSSASVSAAVVSKVAKPSINPLSASTTKPVAVTITCLTSGATIRYTTNGSVPTSLSLIYQTAFTLNSSATVMARAFRSGMVNSDVATATYQIKLPVATPILSPGSTSFTSIVTVTMMCATSGVTIRYTTNGTDPVSSSAIYTAPIKLLKTTTLKARAFRSGMTDSAVASATYTVPSKYITFTRSYSPRLASPVSAQNLFDRGAALLLRDDDGNGNGDANDDVSLDVHFYVPNAAKVTFPNQSASTFPLAERFDYTQPKYNDVPNNTTILQLLGAKFANVKQVNSISTSNGQAIGVTATGLSRASMILAKSATITTAVHEWGHLCGLPDYYGSADTRRIMYGVGISGPCEINVTERAAMSAY